MNWTLAVIYFYIGKKQFNNEFKLIVCCRNIQLIQETVWCFLVESEYELPNTYIKLF